MNHFRLFSDDDGESRIEEIQPAYFPADYAPPAPPFDISEPTQAARYVFVRFPAGWTSDYHPVPRRQLFVVLSGAIEGRTSGGRRFTLEPGHVLLMEDTGGKGHAARTIGETDVLALMVHLE
jgi:quercetin dioxygenase-like cupin family protein